MSKQKRGQQTETELADIATPGVCFVINLGLEEAAAADAGVGRPDASIGTAAQAE